MLEVGGFVQVKSEGPYAWDDVERVIGKKGVVTETDEAHYITVRFNDLTNGHGDNGNEWCVHVDDLISEVQKIEKSLFPIDAAERKKIPVASGVLDYFPAALVEVAKVSYAGNQQHNPGEPLHWARNKSTDQDDTIIRHFLERGTFDTDGLRHTAKLAWRVLALLQLELEAEGAPTARGAK